MSQRGRLLTMALTAFILVSIITTATTLYFYQEYTSTNERYEEYYQKYVSAEHNFTSIRNAVIQVNVTLDYGNGTIDTNDLVYLAPNTTVLDGLRAVASVNTTYWPAFQAWFIDAINNVFNNENGNNRWWVYSVNGEHALIGAAEYKIRDGDQIEWTYQRY